jgi:hypothetical protein
MQAKFKIQQGGNIPEHMLNMKPAVCNTATAPGVQHMASGVVIPFVITLNDFAERTPLGGP